MAYKQYLRRILFLIVLTLGLSSCTQQEGEPDTWDLKPKPQIKSVDSDLRGLKSYSQNNELSILTTDMLVFPGAPTTGDPKVLVSSSVTCNISGLQLPPYNTNFYLKSQVPIYSILPLRLLYRVADKPDTPTACNFEFKAVNNVGTSRPFNVPQARVISVPKEATIIVKEGARAIDLEDSIILHENNFEGVSFISRVGAYKYRLQCETFSTEFWTTHNDIQFFPRFSLENLSPETNIMTDPLGTKPLQTCRIFEINEDLVTRVSPYLRLQFRTPEHGIKTSWVKTPKYEGKKKKKRMHFASVHISNPNDYPVYFRIPTALPTMGVDAYTENLYIGASKVGSRFAVGLGFTPPKASKTIGKHYYFAVPERSTKKVPLYLQKGFVCQRPGSSLNRKGASVTGYFLFFSQAPKLEIIAEANSPEVIEQSPLLPKQSDWISMGHGMNGRPIPKPKRLLDQISPGTCRSY